MKVQRSTYAKTSHHVLENLKSWDRFQFMTGERKETKTKPSLLQAGWKTLFLYHPTTLRADSLAINSIKLSCGGCMFISSPDTGKRNKLDDQT